MKLQLGALVARKQQQNQPLLLASCHNVEELGYQFAFAA